MEGIATVQSRKNKSRKKSFGGLNREVMSYGVDTMQLKVSSSDQADYMSSHGRHGQVSACQALPQDICLTERSGLSSFQQ